MRPRSIFTRSCVMLFALVAVARLATAEPAMWIIKDKDSTIYLFGTIHFLRSDTAWQTPKIRSALGESTELWLEIADLHGDQTALLAKYDLDPSQPLSSR